jgi:hypothetical protein
MRSMIHDSKLRQRGALTTVFKAILTPIVRPRVLALPVVADIAATSVVAANPPPFAALWGLNPPMAAVRGMALWPLPPAWIRLAP